MQDTGGKGLSPVVMEVAVAAATGISGIAVYLEARKAGAGWTDMGPDAGYFPFYIGLLIVFGSAVNLIQGFVMFRRSGEVFLDAKRFRVVLAFLLPMAAFLVASLFLGLYVGTAASIAGTMAFQGGYRWWISVLADLAVAVFFYVVFELGFQIPLLKEAFEAWLGIY